MAEETPLAPNAEGEQKKETPNGQEGGEQRPFEPFTEKQQAKMNAVVDEAFGRAYNKAKTEYEAKHQDAVTKIAELQKQVETLTKPATPNPDEGNKGKGSKKETPADDDRVAQVQARLQELESASQAMKEERDNLRERLKSQESESKETRIKEAFISAASKLDFYDSMDVFRLVRNDFAIDKDSGRVVVLNASGNPRLNSDLEPMTLGEFLGDFAKSKPHMVKAKNTEGGTGAGASRGVNTSEKKPDWAKMTPEEFRAYTNTVIAGR